MKPVGTRTVLVLEDEEHHRSIIQAALAARGYAVTVMAFGSAFLEAAARGDWSAYVLDLKITDAPESILRDEPREMTGQYGGLGVLRELRKRGLPLPPTWILTAFAEKLTSEHRAELARLGVPTSRIINKLNRGAARLAGEIAHELRALGGFDDGKDDPRILATEQPGLAAVMEEVADAARRDTNLIIVGEPGLGKEWLARQYYRNCGRVGPMKTVACGALDGEAINHTFCGRADNFPQRGPGVPGVFEEAGHGVVYLADLDKLTLGTGRQPTVLFNVMGDRPFVLRMGGTQPVPIRCRVVVSANRLDTLHPAIVDRFSRVEVPPLRQRRADIPALVRFLHKREHAADFDPPTELGDEEIAPLLQAPLLGNIRDLEHWVATRRFPATEGPVTPRRLPALHLSIALDDQNRAPYNYWFGHDGKLQRQYLTWLLESGLDLEELRKITGLTRKELEQKLEAAKGTRGRSDAP